MSTDDERADWYRSLPAKRMAAGVLLRDGDGRIMLLETTYKDRWEIPGGVVEVDESPRAAARREVGEELGIDLEVGRLLVMHWRPAASPRTEALMFVYDGGVLNHAVEELVLPPDEIRAIHLVAVDELPDVPMALPVRRRLQLAIDAADTGALIELDDL